MNLIEQIPDEDINTIFEIVSRFAAVEFATPHDEHMYEEARAAIARGEYVRHEDINWG
jgi:hypothetical protein